MANSSEQGADSIRSSSMGTICAQHSIDVTGNTSFLCFYEETGAGQFVPRNLMVDLEPNVIDDVKNSQYSKIFHLEFLLGGKEDAANNFARGRYTVGKEMIDKVNDRLRKLVDNVQGFVINLSVGGGTGSGLGALILETIAVDYRKKSKLGFEVYPSPTISTCAVLDNEAIYEMCQKWLDRKRPSDNLNRLITKTISSMTASLRFEGELNVDLNELQSNLVPFPRLHFMITAMAPVVTKKKMDSIVLLIIIEIVNAELISVQITDNINKMQQYPDFRYDFISCGSDNYNCKKGKDLQFYKLNDDAFSIDYNMLSDYKLRKKLKKSKKKYIFM